MAYRVKIMPRAERDLTDIYRKIQARTFDAARTWYVGLKKSIRTFRHGVMDKFEKCYEG